MPKKKQTPMKNGMGPLFSVVFLALVLAAIYSFWNPLNEQAPEEVNLSQFVEDVEGAKVDTVTVEDSKVTYELTDGDLFFAYKESGQTVSEVLNGVDAELARGFDLEVKNTASRGIWLNLALSAIPILLIIGFFWFMMRGAASSNNQAMSFGQSKARLHDNEKKKTTFKDVAGADEAKEELEEIVDFLKSPTKYTAMGAKIPKGVMLVGAPGTGKTLLARAVAGEAKVPFFTISGSEFVEMFVGVGASRVRDLFKKAKRNAPCIVFVDEIDAVGRKRGAGLGGGHDEREQTLNQILTEMDGFDNDTNVIVMAATNRPDVLDPALLRPGRFDRRVVVDKPGLKGREEILDVHVRNKPLNDKVDLKEIAKQTPGFSGADLENLLNESAILAAKTNKKEITQDHIEQSIEKVSLGPERKSRVMSKKEKEVTAYHEMGHAIVGHVLEDCDSVKKITIVSRGMALGATWFVPDEDTHLYTRQKFEHEMASLLGGYVAEEMIFGQTSTGPSNDLERANKMARSMVTRYGMSKLGPVVYGDEQGEVFLGKDLAHTRNYSEAKAAAIDELVKEYIDAAYKQAKDILTKHKDKFVSMSKELLKKETLSQDEFVELFEGKKLKKKAA